MHRFFMVTGTGWKHQLNKEELPWFSYLNRSIPIFSEKKIPTNSFDYVHPHLLLATTPAWPNPLKMAGSKTLKSIILNRLWSKIQIPTSWTQRCLIMLGTVTIHFLGQLWNLGIDLGEGGAWDVPKTERPKPNELGCPFVSGLRHNSMPLCLGKWLPRYHQGRSLLSHSHGFQPKSGWNSELWWSTDACTPWDGVWVKSMRYHD